MARIGNKTLRRLPPKTREIARLTNELASVQTRLYNRIDSLAANEQAASVDGKAQDYADRYREIVGAALAYVDACESDGMTFADKHDALERLTAAVAPLRVPVFEDGDSDGETEADEEDDPVDPAAIAAIKHLDADDATLTRAKQLATARHGYRGDPPVDDVARVYQRLLRDPDYDGGRWDDAVPDADAEGANDV